VFGDVEEILEYVEDQHGKDEYNLKHLKSYKKDKDKKPTLEKEVIKKVK
jgi:hypothetical protein